MFHALHDKPGLYRMWNHMTYCVSQKFSESLGSHFLRLEFGNRLILVNKHSIKLDWSFRHFRCGVLNAIWTCVIQIAGKNVWCYRKIRDMKSVETCLKAVWSLSKPFCFLNTTIYNFHTKWSATLYHTLRLAWETVLIRLWVERSI